MKFIKVKCKNGFHIVRLDLIERVHPYTESDFKSKIILSDHSELYSIEDQSEIYEKLTNAKKDEQI